MMNERERVPLSELPPGAQGLVRQMGGGADFRGRLAAMGLGMGTRVEMLQNTGRGPVLLRVQETRVALGRGEAMKILVDEIVDARSR
jgi:ferrous iron transport protein A